MHRYNVLFSNLDAIKKNTKFDADLVLPALIRRTVIDLTFLFGEDIHLLAIELKLN